MTIKEKIDFLLKTAINSDAAYVNGNICVFNEYETNRDKQLTEIVFDTADGDDYYCSFKFSDVVDIELENGKFTIISENKKDTIVFLVVNKVNFD